MGMDGILRGFKYHLAGNIVQDLSTMGGAGFMAFVYGSFFSNPSNYWFQICSKVIGKLAAIVPVAISQVYFMREFATDNGSSTSTSASTKRDNVASSATLLLGTVPMWVLAKEALWAIIPEKIVLGSFYFKRGAELPKFSHLSFGLHLGALLAVGTSTTRVAIFATSHRQNTLVYSKALHCPVHYWGTIPRHIME